MKELLQGFELPSTGVFFSQKLEQFISIPAKSELLANEKFSATLFVTTGNIWTNIYPSLHIYYEQMVLIAEKISSMYIVPTVVSVFIVIFMTFRPLYSPSFYIFWNFEPNP